jgi:hypothetical protein
VTCSYSFACSRVRLRFVSKIVACVRRYRTVLATVVLRDSLVGWETLVPPQQEHGAKRFIAVCRTPRPDRHEIWLGLRKLLQSCCTPDMLCNAHHGRQMLGYEDFGVSLVGLPNTEPKTATRRKFPESRCWIGVGACLHCDKDACLLSERIPMLPAALATIVGASALHFPPGGCTKRLTKRSGGAYVR